MWCGAGRRWVSGLPAQPVNRWEARAIFPHISWCSLGNCLYKSQVDYQLGDIFLEGLESTQDLFSCKQQKAGRGGEGSQISIRRTLASMTKNC